MRTHLAFGALADDVRRSILRVLRTSGVVTEPGQGRHCYYSLDSEGPTRDALEFLQGLLRPSLRELTSNAEAPAPSGTECRREAG